jgi:hypothetical protein
LEVGNEIKQNNTGAGWDLKQRNEIKQNGAGWDLLEVSESEM